MIGRSLTFAISVLLLACPAVAQDSGEASITVLKGWSRPAPASAPVLGGYLTIRNAGSEADRLLSISSSISDDVQIHRTTVENDRASMRQMKEGVEIPANSDVQFQPSSYHIMFMRPKARPGAGQAIPVTLHFAKAGEVDAELLVISSQSGSITHSGNHKK